MEASTIIFYILGALILTFGFLSVYTRMIFRSAIFLLFSLIGVAGVYLMMDMEFIAALQIIIYVGGIVVLIIFSIFLTHKSGDNLPKQTVRRKAVAIALSSAGFLFISTILFSVQFAKSAYEPMNISVENIGRQLLDYQKHGYVLPFEIVSVLLLAALIGSIVIAMKEKVKN